MTAAKRTSFSSLIITSALWTIILMIPFSVLMFDTHIRLRIIHNDYRVGQLTKEIMALKQQLADLRAHEADLMAMRRMEAMAPELGLIPASPGQVILVKVPESRELNLPKLTFAKLYSDESESKSHMESNQPKGNFVQR